MLGARIAALRREAGMSQAELACQLKISSSAVGMYEQGRREPAADTLVAISRVFGISVDYLLTGTPSEKEAGRLEQMLCSRIAAADSRLESRLQRPFSSSSSGVSF